MSTYSNQFTQPAGMKRWGMALTGVGALSLVGGLALLAFSKDEHDVTRFWAVLLQNSVYFLLVVNAAMFFLAATQLAWAGFTQSFKRVGEAISTLVIPFGVLALIVLLGLVFGHQHHISNRHMKTLSCQTKQRKIVFSHLIDFQFFLHL